MQRQRLLLCTKQVEQDLYAAAGFRMSTLKDKIVIIVDDGVATGMTAVAAVQTARTFAVAAHVVDGRSRHESGIG